jgi:hypothetical protein
MLGYDPTHDLLVSSALYSLAGMDDVRAVDTTGRTAPDPIDGHVPDVTGASLGTPIIAEAITATQLADPQTLAKIRAFWPRPYAADGGRSALHLVIETDQEDRLRDLMRSEGLDPDDEKVSIHRVTVPR